jgi:hypothetical protein
MKIIIEYDPETEREQALRVQTAVKLLMGVTTEPCWTTGERFHDALLKRTRCSIALLEKTEQP